MWLERLIHDPLTRLIAQIVAVIVVSRLLGIVCKRLNQPMVIAEITAGILLGPSLLGLLWPEVGKVLFPPDSLKSLSLLSQVGLVLFMFLIGLELDLGLLKGRGKASVAISHSSIVVPFALGAALAFYMYPRWSSPEVPFTSFVLFLGAAMSITAFPVLARILSERQLLTTRVGAVTIACAAVDDVTAWCLLAFIVAAAKSNGFAAAGITTALALAYIVVMFWIVRPLLGRVGARVGSREGLTQNVVAAILLLLFISSWLTELIGIHALFGAFLFGSIIPKAGGLAHALAEKLEDLVLVVLLPLFFAFSGVRTQIGLLDSSAAWVACGLVILVACLGKFGGSFAAARLTGLGWRESGALGILMNTRGLMELIVLNLGLDLGILSPTLFTMMVVMALVTTAMTSPILELVYPRELLAREEAAAISVAPSSPRVAPALSPLSVLVCVGYDRSGTSLMTLAAALRGHGAGGRVHALHLVPPTDRASFYVENGADSASVGLGPLLEKAEDLGVSVVPNSFVSSEPGADICRVARQRHVDLTLMGWHRPVLSQTLLGGPVGEVIEEADGSVGVFVDRGLSQLKRVLVPFVGTPHDRAAIALAKRLLSGEDVHVTLLHVQSPGASGAAVDQMFEEPEGGKVTVRVVRDDSPVDVALEESAAGYDLIVVGLGREFGLEGGLLGLHAQRLMRDATVSTLVVRGPLQTADAAHAALDPALARG